MLALLAKLNKHLVFAIPVSMLLGLATGGLMPVDGLKRLIVPLTVLMVFPMMVNLKPGKLLEKGDGRALFLAQAINFGLIPFIAWGLGHRAFPDQPYLAAGLLLAALLPTSGMTIAWTGLAGGNLGAAVKMTVLGLLLGSIATPFYMRGLLGAAVPVDLGAVFVQIGLIVVVPLLAGQVTRKMLLARVGPSTFQAVWAPRFPPLSTLGVLGIVFVAMALKADALTGHPARLAGILGPLLALYAINYGLSTLLGRKWLARGDAIALVYGTVMRNLSIALALAMNTLGEGGADAALVIALAYLIQVQSAAWYVKFTDRLFGRPAPGR